MSGPVSLEAVALAYLARREHSRAELRLKLIAKGGEPHDVDALLDRLADRRLLSEERFIEGLVHRRAGRFGAARIRQELRSHQLDPEHIEASVAALRATEFDRAREVWRKRFREPSASREDKLRQMRFLASRGFSAEVVRRVLGGGDD